MTMIFGLGARTTQPLSALEPLVYMAHSIRIYAAPNACAQLAELGIIDSPDDDAPEEMKNAVRFAYERGRLLEQIDRRWGNYPSSRVAITWPIFGEDEEWWLELALDEAGPNHVVIASVIASYRIPLEPLV